MLVAQTHSSQGEWNVLINPLHPQFSLTWIVSGPRCLHLRCASAPDQEKDSIPQSVAAVITSARLSKIVDKKWTWRHPLFVSC
jgi:hypothetical protein